MSRDSLTGSRIRERRIILGLRQASLARSVGISASYLNLIEHNRRRIGGKLLLSLANELSVEPSTLTEGAEAALLSTLREAAADAPGVPAETDRADEFAGRFPGWAAVLADAHRRISGLERTVETMADRLLHDPNLAASLHEVLSTAAAIRSTASILAETGELEPEWRDRFHRNLNEDSRRLADSSKALVSYLDETGEARDRRRAPQEEAEAFFAANGHHFHQLETGAISPEALVEGADMLSSDASRDVARILLQQYAADIARLPLARMQAALAEHGLAPERLAAALEVDFAALFRRLSSLPDTVLPGEVGLVVCDLSGAIIYRKPISGFALPRFGASCPLWPVFSAMGRPMVPIRRRVSQQGRSAAAFDCYAVAQPQGAQGFDADPLFLSTMLILPAGAEHQDAPEVRPVGSTCRVCPRETCAARREPSILSDAF